MFPTVKNRKIYAGTLSPHPCQRESLPLDPAQFKRKRICSHRSELQILLRLRNQ